MNKTYFIQPILIAAMLLVPGTLLADDDGSTNLNHFGFSARAGFNVTARFTSLGNLTLAPNTRLTPNGNPYNYSNGYVLTDISGSAGGQTWYWGYDNPNQISGNTILMSRSTISTDASTPADAGNINPNYGCELTYNRELGNYGKWRYGVESAVNYTKIFLQDSSTFYGNVNQTTDAYPFTPGTTPPQTPPPYQGTFNGPGFLLGSTPSSSTTTVVPGGAVITGSRQFSTDIFGFRLGPYVEYPLTEKLDLSLSAGLALGLLDNSASWNETIYVSGGQTATSTGSGRNLALVWGGYVSAKATWQLSERWSAEGSLQYQNLGTYDGTVGGRAIELDLSKSIFVTVGVGYKF